MVSFTVVLKKFGAQGEKTGWTYFEIPAALAARIKPGGKRSFRVKGFLDMFPIQQVAMIPMGEGDFIIPVNEAMRKGTGKRQGASLKVRLEEDEEEQQLDSDFISCLEDDAAAMKFFQTLTPGRQRYFSKWIISAKTEETKAKRIATAIRALARKMEYGPMMREMKEENKLR